MKSPLHDVAPARGRAAVRRWAALLFLVEPLLRVGAGATVDAQETPDPTEIERLLERLRSADDADRFAAYRALSPRRRGDQPVEASPLLIRELLALAGQRDAAYPMEPAPALAMRLLGDYGCEEAIPLLIERISDDFPRLIVSAETAPTEAAGALIAIGSRVIEPILDRVETASDEEWGILSLVLRRLDRPVAVSSAFEGRLERQLSALARERLAAFRRR